MNQKDPRKYPKAELDKIKQKNTLNNTDDNFRACNLCGMLTLKYMMTCSKCQGNSYWFPKP